MAVQVVCSCGKTLRVPDDSSKRPRCPDCGADLTGGPVTTTAPPAEPAGRTVRFPCSKCGRQLEALAEDAGCCTPCPGCKAQVLIPADRRRRVLALALVVLGVVLAGAGVWWYFWRQVGNDGPEVAALDLIPADAEGFVSVRLAEVWANPAVQNAVQAARERDPRQEDLATRLERNTGLRPEELEQVHVIGVDRNWRHGWVVARTHASIDRPRVLSRLSNNRRSVRHEGRRYHLGHTDEGEELAVHFAGPRVLVIAAEEGMKRCLELAVRPVRTGPLEEIIALTREKSQVVAGLNGASAGVVRFRDNPLLKPLADVRLARVTLDVDRNAVLDLRATFGDEEAAKEARKWLNDWKAKAAGLLLFGGLLGGLDADTIDRLSKLLKSVKPEVKGNDVALKVQTDPSTLAGALLLGTRALKR
jgi:hypothetical protein